MVGIWNFDPCPEIRKTRARRRWPPCERVIYGWRPAPQSPCRRFKLSQNPRRRYQRAPAENLVVEFFYNPRSTQPKPKYNYLLKKDLLEMASTVLSQLR